MDIFLNTISFCKPMLSSSDEQSKLQIPDPKLLCSKLRLNAVRGFVSMQYSNVWAPILWDNLRMEQNTIEKCKSPCIYEELAGEFKLISVREIGKDVVLNLSIRSLTTKPKQVNVDIKASSVLYTKKEIHELLKESKTICVPGCEGTEVPVVITYAMYEDLLTADNSIEVTAVCTCEPYDGLLIIETNVVLDNPKFEIKLNKKVNVDKPVEVDIIFTNPLDKEVSNIVVTAEGSGLLKDPVSVTMHSVKPKETVTIPIIIKPYKAGLKHLLVDFTTNKFQNAKGYLEIEVHEAK